MRLAEERLRKKNQEMTVYFEKDSQHKTEHVLSYAESTKQLEEQLAQMIDEKKELRDLYLASEEKMGQMEMECEFKS